MVEKANYSVKTKKFLELLLNLTNRLIVTEGLDNTLLTLVELTSDALDCERSTIFINDTDTNELYSKVAQGKLLKTIRFPNSDRLAGWCFQHDDTLIVNDPYNDPRFDEHIDKTTGFVTKNVVCVPLKTHGGQLIGVVEALNKFQEGFTENDVEVLRLMSTQASIAIQNKMFVKEIEQDHAKKMDLLEVVSSVSSEIQLSVLLKTIIEKISTMLGAERSTLFINDPVNNELFTEIGEGIEAKEIRFPNHLGIAGQVFQSGETVSIPYAYADMRFNPSVDKQTGFFTRSILCTPVKTKAGEIVGVTQVLNKIGGQFTLDDELQLIAFTSQIAITIENARLFADVNKMKNYNESILQSMSNSVITLDESCLIKTCNRAGMDLLGINSLSEIKNQAIATLFPTVNLFSAESLSQGSEVGEARQFMDVELPLQEHTVSANVTILPLVTANEDQMGSMIVIDDISNEKRIKATMSRYISPELSEQLLQSDDNVLGGTEGLATVLFSDIRNFTGISEQLGAKGTVSLLNDYFTLMVEAIQTEGGTLDKFIGDAIMAIFGIPFSHEDDPDRALRAAINMMRAIKEFNRQNPDFPILKHSVGLNTDLIVSGNIGSPKRMDYTVIGDGVNLASRLESACKQYGVQLIISENTFSRLKATYRTRQLDKVMVKGKNQAVTIFDVVDGYDSDEFPNQVEVLGHFHDGLEYYYDRAWDKGIQCFERALKAHPQDTPSLLYLERCKHLKAHPPPDDWDKVWVMTSK